MLATPARTAASSPLRGSYEEYHPRWVGGLKAPQVARGAEGDLPLERATTTMLRGPCAANLDARDSSGRATRSGLERQHPWKADTMLASIRVR